MKPIDFAAIAIVAGSAAVGVNNFYALKSDAPVQDPVQVVAQDVGAIVPAVCLAPPPQNPMGPVRISATDEEDFNVIQLEVNQNTLGPMQERQIALLQGKKSGRKFILTISKDIVEVRVAGEGAQSNAEPKPGINEAK